MANEQDTENDRAEWRRLMLANALLDFTDPERVASQQRDAQHSVALALCNHPGGPGEEVRAILLCRLRTTNVMCELPEDWPEDRDPDEFYQDGAGGSLCPIYTNDCHAIMRSIYDLFNAPSAIAEHFSVPTSEVAEDVYVGTNHESTLGIRPRGAPDLSDPPCNVEELPEGVLHKLYGNKVYRAGYYCACDDPRATASLVLRAYERPDGQWFVMRCNSTFYAWNLHAAPTNVPRYGPPPEDAAIFA